MATPSDEERLLRILHTHGQQFMRAFDIPAVPKHEIRDPDASESEEEWAGICSSPNTSSEAALDGGDDENDPDNFVGDPPSTPDVTVFLESSRKQPPADCSAKELRKSFMSSKVSNIALSGMQHASRRQIPGDSDDERTNIQNDIILHRLVHTKLLSGSLNPELHLNHAQRGRALAGRVLELAGEVKLGKGESAFYQEERNKAAKRVRDGLIRKKREQEHKALIEAKNLGNYHPTLKRLYHPSTSSTSKKKRTRGLGMGVGKFVGGTLKLSREEISSATVSGKRPGNNSHKGRCKRLRRK